MPLHHLTGRDLDYYNCRRRHSTLGNLAPMRYIIKEEILPQPALGLALQRT